MLAFFLSLLASATPSPAANLTRFEFTRPAMGMPFPITLHAHGQATAHAAADTAMPTVSQADDTIVSNSCEATRFDFTRPAMGMPFPITLHARDQATAHAAADTAMPTVSQAGDTIVSNSCEATRFEFTRPAAMGMPFRFTLHARDQATAHAAADTAMPTASQAGDTIVSNSCEATRFEFTRPAMGMPIRITLYAPDRAKADVASDAAFKRIKEINAILSDYEPDSELSRLSKTSGSGQDVPLSPALWTVLSRAQELSRRSDGAFDVTVGPCVWLWRKTRMVRKLPDPDALAEAMKAVGWRKIQLDARKCVARLLAPNMRLDLGAIAKGYVADEALAALRKCGVTRALVVAGGDMALGDPPPGKPGWRIAVASLDVTDQSKVAQASSLRVHDPPQAGSLRHHRFIIASRCGLATSGDLFQHVEIDGKRYSHIVDPRTGVGLTDHSLVVVIARDGITADGLSTTVSVLGPQAGLKLTAATPGTEVFFARKPGDEIETYQSKGFAKFWEKQ